MQMEREKPRNRKKKAISPEEPSIVNKQDAETAVVLEEQTEELGSWEDLHVQVSDLDKLYPSAPAGPILEFEEPSLMVTFPKPLLTMTAQESEQGQPIEVHSEKIIQPSSPEFPEHHVDLMINASAPPFKADFASLNWSPMPVDVLEKIYSNPAELEYNINVSNFRDSLNSSNQDNEFYRKLKEYQISLMELEDIKKKILSDSGSIQHLSSKYWTLEREPVTVKDYCPDGWSVSHTLINEKPVFHSELDVAFENAFHEMKKTVYIDHVRLSYNSKYSKSWIQNYINETVYGELSNAILRAQKANLRGIDNFKYASQIQKITEMVDILFHFEKMSSNNKTLSGQFENDVRSWIIHLAGIIYWTGNQILDQRILLHILRTPGITNWGPFLVNFQTPISFSDDFVDNYIVALKAFLGPIEELEEVLGPRRDMENWERVQVKKLETDHWVVIEDSLFSVPLTRIPHSICLLESDYSNLLRQFNITPTFSNFIQRYFSIAKTSGNSFVSENVGSNIMKGFSVAHRFYLILSRSFQILPMNLAKVRDLIASQLVLLFQALVDNTKMFTREDIISQIYFSVPGEGLKQTTIQNELDSILYRIAKILLSAQAAGLGKYLGALDWASFSPVASSQLIRDLISGDLFNDSQREELEGKDLISVLLRDENWDYIFQLLEKLLVSGTAINSSLGIIIVDTCFSICLANVDLQESLFANVTRLLISLTSNNPALIGYILEKSEDNFDVVEKIAFRLFEKLPIEDWAPVEADIIVLENMLKDPLSSSKSYLARTLISAVKWEEGKTPRYCHKALCLSIANLYLDHAGRAQHVGIVRGASQAIFNSAKKLANIVDHVQDYFSWSWTIIQRLNLYVRDTTNESFNEYAHVGKAYDLWDSSSLAVVKSYSPSNGLACFVGLITSEIGHRFDLFDSIGWRMLQQIIVEGKLEAYLRACFEIFLSFYTTSNPDILNSPQCQKSFLQFWSSDVAGRKTNILHFLKHTLSTSISSLAEIQFVVRFWCSLVFSSPNWYINSLELEILDEFCRLTYQTQHSFELLSVFSIQYRKLIFSYGPCVEDQQKSAWKVPSPVAKIFNTAKEHLYEKSSLTYGFPSFIRVANSLTRPTFYAANCHYFLLIATSVEVFAERDIRQQIGSKLVRGVSITDSVLENAAEKPVYQFCIYKILDMLLEAPMDHPTTPIMCQTFFSLFFERYKSSDDLNGVMFGYKFFEISKLKLSELEKRFQDANFRDPLMSNWNSVLRSFAQWVMDPRLILDPSSVNSLPASYSPHLLKSCIAGSLFDNGNSEWWKDLVPISVEPIQELSQISLKLKVERSLDPISIEGPKEHPILSFSEPLVPNISILSVKEILESVNSEIALLKQQGFYHSSCITQHNDLDAEYFMLLKRLYESSTVQSSVTKRCTSSCEGVSISFTMTKSSIDQLIMEKITQNRDKVQKMIATELVDLRTSLSGLRLLSMIFWFAENSSASKIISKEAVQLFFHALDLFELNLHAYPPADSILNLVLKEIGQNYIVGREKETAQIFHLLAQKKHIELLAQYFLPSSCPTQFTQMYVTLSNSLDGDDAKTVISCFHISTWIDEQNPDESSVFEFLCENLEIIRQHQSDSSAMASHFLIFREVMIKCPEMLPAVTNKIWDLLLSSVGIPSMILKGLLGSFINIPEAKLKLVSFTESTSIENSLVVSILNCTHSKLSEYFAKDHVHFIQTIKSFQFDLIHFLTGIFSCRNLYQNPSEFQFNQLQNKLLLLFLPIFQISGITNSKLNFLEVFTAAELDNFTKNFSFLTEKLCYHFNLMKVLPSCLWQMYEHILPTQSYTLLNSFHENSSSILSKDFVLTDNEFSVIANWIIEKTFNGSSVQYLSRILMSCSISLRNTTAFNDVFVVIMWCMIHFDDLPVDKLQFFQLSAQILGDPLFLDSSLSDMEIGMSLLPERWFDSLVTLRLNTDSIKTLPACCLIILKTIKLGCTDKKEKQLLLLKYLLNLLEKQTLPEIIGDPLILQSRAFEEESLGIILKDIVALFEIENGTEVLLAAIDGVLQIISQSAFGSKIYSRLCQGFTAALKETNHPVVVLKGLCRSPASPEQMAIWSEDCIERLLEIRNNSLIWEDIKTELVIPELNESVFIRNCLSHGLILTLYSHSQIRLANATNNYNLKIMIGEQIAAWIDSIQIGNSKHPSNILLMILQYLFLLNLELSTDDTSARLVAHLPSFQETLFKWSNPPTMTLWSALGFSKPSSMPAKLRLIFRFLATFIASRLLKVEQQTENDKLVETFDLFVGDYEFSEFTHHVTEMKVAIGSDKSLVKIYQISLSLCNSLFPEITPSSVVCFAREASTLQNVVLKKVSDSNLANSEITALKELSHVNTRTPTLLNSFPDSNQSSTTLVFPVYTPLQWEKIDLLRIARITKELAEILHNVHSSGWVHLDISPNNVMVDTNGDLVLIDFALAKKVGQEHKLGCGTPGFIAPEVYESMTTTPTSDIYSLGVFFGAMMEVYMPGVSLQYLGSALVRPQTTAFICKKILEVQEACREDCVWAPIIYHAADLLFKMIQTDSSERITAEEILKHPFLTADVEEYAEFTYECHVKKLLLRPVSAMKAPKKDFQVMYRY